MASQHDTRPPYPLTWEEQEHLLSFLPPHLESMVLFAVNTGCREQEICSLRWDWECWLDDTGQQSVFVIPGDWVKNGDDRLVVLNKIAKSVIEKARGNHPEYVFTYLGHPVGNINNTAWKRARNLAGLDVRVHDLKHTFGRRLRAAGVSFEDRQDLLGHKAGRITTHYSAAEITSLIEAANKICEPKQNAPILRVLNGKKPVSRKTPAGHFLTRNESCVSS